MSKWYNKNIESVLKEIESHRNGLSDQECAARFRKFGANKLEEKDRKSIFAMLFDQVKETMVLAGV